MRTHALCRLGLRFSRAFLFVGIILFSIASARAVVIPTVSVGNAGNAPDSTGFGSVSYDYRIGTTEVTNAQYVAFLNAKAKSDPLALYSEYMGGNVNITRGGITRSGTDGSYIYATKADMGNKPVNHVSWYDAIRFANWLNNGQGDGDTETGAYTLGPLGAGGIPTDGALIERNIGATWFLPSENEWYKAAYYQPAAQGGDSDSYWLYPTRSNGAPTIATANSVGDISNPGTNVANYSYGADWNSVNGNVTTVGSAGPLSNSYYGTYDQGGNVGEWNEALIDQFRGIWSSACISTANNLEPSGGSSFFPTNELPWNGFRVATVPEPSTYAMAAIGAFALLAVKRRKSAA